MAGEGNQAIAIDIQIVQTLLTAEIWQINNKCGVGNFTPQTADQFGSRFDGPAGSQQVIDNKDFFTWLDSVGVNFQAVGAVFQLVAFAERSAWQLARLTYGNKAHSQRQSDGRTKQETACFSTYDFGYPCVTVAVSQ